MDWFDWVWESKIFEWIMGGIFGVIIDRICNPPERPSSSPSTLVAAQSLMVQQINVLVQQEVSRNEQRRPRSLAEQQEIYQLTLFYVVFATVGSIVAIVVYGTLVVQLVEFAVAATVMTALLLAWRIQGSPAFSLPSWMFRVGLILAVCLTCLIALNYAEIGIDTSIVRAQRQGYRIANLQDMLWVFGMRGFAQIWNYAVALLAVCIVMLVALLVQFHTLLSAHAAAVAGDLSDWRVKLLRFIGNRSSAREFTSMIFLSLFALALASGWVERVWPR
jgi:hypothetical protein